MFVHIPIYELVVMFVILENSFEGNRRFGAR